ncbi:hypothetical protein RCL1_005400 [Eukaryota sp. TZLM3-RCL]
MKKLVLISADGEKFVTEPEIADVCAYVRNIVDANGPVDIPIPGVTAKYLQRALDFARFHLKATSDSQGVTDEQIIQFNRQFIIEVDHETLFHTLLAGNFLGMPALIDLCCKTIANVVSSKNPEQLRTIFNIPNDFQPSEMDALKKELEQVFGSL